MRRPFLSAVTGIALLAACGGETITDPSPVVGTYTLQTVNGRALPHVLDQAGGSRDEIAGGRITLSSERMFHQEIDVRTISSAGTISGGTVHIWGTYSRWGDALIVKGRDGSSHILTLSGSTLAQAQHDLTLVYARD